MNEELKSIFGDSIEVKGESIPVAHLRYKGKSKRFITWTVIDEVPSFSANDEPLFSVVTVDIDIFSDSETVKQITLEEADEFLKNVFKNGRMTLSVVYPADEKGN